MYLHPSRALLLSNNLQPDPAAGMNGRFRVCSASTTLRQALLEGFEGRIWRSPKSPQVYFLGAEAAVQQQPSSTWLAEAAQAWPWKTSLLVNAPREEALGVLRQPGMLAVFCSLVDNLPYVVAEVGIGLWISTLLGEK